MYEGVIIHFQGGTGVAVQVCNPVTDLIVTSCYEAELFTV